MLVATDIGSTMATTPSPTSIQSHAMPASPSSQQPPQTVLPQQGVERPPKFVTCVAKCTNLGRLRECACQNMGGQEYNIHDEGGNAGAANTAWLDVLVSMRRSLEKVLRTHQLSILSG